jgi:hypothetical protein
VNNNSGGGGAIITAKEEPIEMTTAASINTTAVRTAPPAPKVPGRRRHIKPERKKFACDKCEFRTAARGNLILHDNSVHLKIKHPCDQCKYEATQVNIKFGPLFRIRMFLGLPDPHPEPLVRCTDRDAYPAPDSSLFPSC